ncbi:MAG: hypothetical protein PSV36_10930 [Algoriphagus sp.]|nr:hypothetical protein [Algoriphagus sp.]
MSRFLLIALLFFSPGMLMAHTPLISSIRIFLEDGVWKLNLSSALTAFQFELQEKYPELVLSEMSEDQILSLMISHTKNTVSLEVNGEAILLQNGMVHPGHQTDLLFDLKEMPENMEEISLTMKSFESITQHSSLLILPDQKNGQNFVINQEKGNSIQIIKDDSGNYMESEMPKKNYPVFWITGIFLLLALGYLFRIRLSDLLQFNKTQLNPIN